MTSEKTENASTPKTNFFFSIRFRIALFLVLTLLGSFTVYFYIASNLMVSDKTSYIFDYSFSQARIAATLFEANHNAPIEIENLARGFEIQILDLDKKETIVKQVGGDNGDPKIAAVLKKAFPEMSELTPFVQEIQNQKLQAGAKETRVSDKNYLIAYEFVQGSKFLVLSIVPQDYAFKAAKVLMVRSMISGLSIFLIAMGLMIVLLKSLVDRLKNLAQATERVAAGDFTTEIKADGGTPDEVTLLGRAFNKMAGKIRELIQKTAAQARMEKELETAQMVQSKFFPKNEFTFGHLSIAGNSLAASECGGDYWQYAKVGRFVVLLLGDVTGHGVSAALVTALIHGAWIRAISEAQKKHIPVSAENLSKELLHPILGQIHESLLATAGEHASFPCMLLAFDPEARKVFLCNAGHPPPILYQLESKTMKAMRTAPSTPLGQDAVVISEMECESFDFKSKDLVFTYTDGYFDARVSDGKALKRKDVITAFEKVMNDAPKNSEAMNRLVQETVIDFFGTDTSNRHDDITFVCISNDAA